MVFFKKKSIIFIFVYLHYIITYFFSFTSMPSENVVSYVSL